MIQKGVTKILTPKSQAILHKHAGVPMQQSSPDAVAIRLETSTKMYTLSTANQSDMTNDYCYTILANIFFAYVYMDAYVS